MDGAESPVADDQTRADALATPEMTDAATAPNSDPTTNESTDATPSPERQTDPQTDEPAHPTQEFETPDMMDSTATHAGRRPTKFMVELSRAMQGAVETSRDETLARFGADAKTAVEEIHAASTVEAAALRRRADDDVAAVREWSKGEIARIREETEGRIAARKTVLDTEIGEHEKVVQTRVDFVARTVADYEADMASYFERLLAEQDPTRIAAMAESMPEPPDLANMAAAITEPAEPYEAPAVMTTVEPEAPESLSSEAPADAEVTESTEAIAEETTAEEATPEVGFAAAEAEAASFSGEPEDDAGPVVETAESESDVTQPETYEANEAETSAPDAGEETPPAEHRPGGERATTRVIVHGLISVASIATFKRSLGRVSGVSAIGVSSGPDGEFVFTVSHDSGLALGDAITALPGFDARIASQTDGGLEIAAHDPDAGD
jgi:hypothetical protein